MQVYDRIRHDASAREILSALSAYARELDGVAAIPEWFARPLRGEDDVHERIAALVAAVNLTSQHRLHADCETAKRALRVYAAALRRLSPPAP
jgi:predicted neuraminidase